jgi:polysaccharide export outer membrane protein
VRELVARARIAALALALLAAAPVAWGQSEYTIGVGDVLAVRVWQRDDLGGQVTVDFDGSVTLPLLGALRAAGQTPARLAEELTRRYSFVDRQVSQVSVTVSEYKSRKVYVMGQVQKPGTYSFPEIPSVWEIIRNAGGPGEGAAMTRVQIIPPEGEGPPKIVDIDRALATGDFSQLPALTSGSTVLVPRSEALGPEGEFVYVYGSVRKPGLIPYASAQDVLAAVLSAGGPDQDANMARVRVVRPGPVQARVFTVDVDDYTEDGVLFPNVPLKPGDTVTVPRDEQLAVLRAIGSFGRTVAQTVGTILFFVRLSD